MTIAKDSCLESLGPVTSGPVCAEAKHDGRQQSILPRDGQEAERRQEGTREEV